MSCAPLESKRTPDMQREFKIIKFKIQISNKIFSRKKSKVFQILAYPTPGPFALPPFGRQSLRFYRAIALRREGNGYAFDSYEIVLPQIFFHSQWRSIPRPFEGRGRGGVNSHKLPLATIISASSYLTPILHHTIISASCVPHPWPLPL